MALMGTHTHRAWPSPRPMLAHVSVGTLDGADEVPTTLHRIIRGGDSAKAAPTHLASKCSKTHVCLADDIA